MCVCLCVGVQICQIYKVFECNSFVKTCLSGIPMTEPFQTKRSLRKETNFKGNSMKSSLDRSVKSNKFWKGFAPVSRKHYQKKYSKGG